MKQLQRMVLGRRTGAATEVLVIKTCLTKRYQDMSDTFDLEFR